MRYSVSCVLASIMMLMATAAPARDIPAGGLTIEDVVRWLQAKGYTVNVVTESDGKQHVSSMLGNVKFGVYMFDCVSEGGLCASLQFSAGFATHGKFDTSQMNAWNRDKRWCRGYFDTENDPWVEYDVDLSPGGTYEMLDDEFATYQKMLDLFVKQYNLGQ